MLLDAKKNSTGAENIVKVKERLVIKVVIDFRWWKPYETISSYYHEMSNYE